MHLARSVLGELRFGDMALKFGIFFLCFYSIVFLAVVTKKKMGCTLIFFSHLENK